MLHGPIKPRCFKDPLACFYVGVDELDRRIAHVVRNVCYTTPKHVIIDDGIVDRAFSYFKSSFGVVVARALSTVAAILYGNYAQCIGDFAESIKKAQDFLQPSSTYC